MKAVRIVALSAETATLADFNQSYAEAESLYVPDVGWVQIDATEGVANARQIHSHPDCRPASVC